MNQVIAGFFDDAHRGLQRQHADLPRAFVGVASHVESLPRLRPGSVSPSASARQTEDGGSWQHSLDNVSSPLRQSRSSGALFSPEQANRGVQEQCYKQALQDNSRLSSKLRATQDQLKITTAKKESFRMQALRLDGDFKKGREQSDTIANELLHYKSEATSSAKESVEAVKMMHEMRKNHVQEVKMLQRGLERMRNEEKFRNRVSETADLVDKLGCAVVQREEAERDKFKAQSYANKMMTDLRAVVDECSKLRRQNKSLDAKLKEAVRRSKAPASPLAERGRGMRASSSNFGMKAKETAFEFDGSDEEFETELLCFENRFQMLEEGPMGLDILASNLAKDKRLLEKALRQEQEEHRLVRASLEEWKALCEEKDSAITTKNKQIEEVMMAQAALEEEIDRKRREVEEAVNNERAKLEERLKELQREAEEARSQADSMVLASDRLSKELVKVHEQYDEAAQRKQIEKEERFSMDVEEPAPENDVGEWDVRREPVPEDNVGEWEMLERRNDCLVKTHYLESPCVLNLEVWKEQHTGNIQLRARKGSDRETRLAVTDDLLLELDSVSPWADLFSRVGFSGDPQLPDSTVCFSELLGEQEKTFDPDGDVVLCRVHRFDAWRYYISGTSLETSFMAEYLISRDELVSDDALSDAIRSGPDASELVNLLLGKLSFHDGGGFKFGVF